MESWILILITALVVVAVVVIGVFIMMSRQRGKSRQTAALRENFGPEYEKAVEEQGRSGGEEDLMRRQQRADLFQVRTLSAVEVDHYSERWTAVEAEFVSDPGTALALAGELIAEVISARGYPAAEFEQGAEALSVDHPRAVQHYRAAHEVAQRNQRNALSTDELRAAMEDYEVVFGSSLGVLEGRRDAVGQETVAAFEAPGADCCAWLQEAGFRETRVEHLVGPESMVVGIK